MKIIINWDKLPRDAQGRVDPTARQHIYLDVDNGLPMVSYEALKGMVLDNIEFNPYKNIVITLRKPIPSDLSEENLNKQPILLSTDIPKEPETIKAPLNPLEQRQMHLQMQAAKNQQAQLMEIAGRYAKQHMK